MPPDMIIFLILSVVLLVWEIPRLLSALTKDQDNQTVVKTEEVYSNPPICTRSAKILYFINIVFGIGLGIFTTPFALFVWDGMVDALIPKLIFVRVVLAFVGSMVGVYISYRIQERYCAASTGVFYILLSIILIFIGFILIVSFIMFIAAIAVTFGLIAGCLSALVVYCFIRIFDRKGS